MSSLPISTIGLRHLALRVRSVPVSKRFYCEIFGMAVVWQPDDKSAYLSSGSDNLALHELDAGVAPTRDPGQALDHLGFLLASRQQVYAAAEALRARGETILREPREHRDGSHSFYMADPDENVVQVLYLPTLAAHSKAP